MEDNSQAEAPVLRSASYLEAVLDCAEDLIKVAELVYTKLRSINGDTPETRKVLQVFVNLADLWSRSVEDACAPESCTEKVH